MNNAYRGPSIDASYQILDQLVLWFQRRRLKCEKLMDDGHQGELKIRIWVMFFAEDPTVTMKCRAPINYFNLCLSVMSDSLSF